MSGKGSSKLAWHKESAEVYGINTIAAIGLIIWSCLTAPAGVHGLEEILWGGGLIIFLSWVIAFNVTGLPVQRIESDRAEINVTPHT